MPRYLFLAFLLLSGSGLVAQTGTITGKVTDKKTGETLPSVSVFLSNATKGTRTDEAGNYTLSAVKAGQYDLVVSMMGYAPFSQHIVVNEDRQVLNIAIEERSIVLNEVRIGSDKEWAANYERFKRDFIGVTENAGQCKILNPEVLNISYDSRARVLEASSDGFMVIENKALGYKLSYLLKNLTSEYVKGYLYYEGQILFEEMKGSSGQVKRWKKRREEAYKGSSMHFFRSLNQQQLTANGFVVRRLKRIDNKERLPDSLIQAKIRKYTTGIYNAALPANDSLSYWRSMLRLPRTMNVLEKSPLKETDILRRTDKPGLYALTFSDLLYVIANERKAPRPPQGIIITSEINDPRVAILQLKDKYAFFDANGIVANPKGIIYEGAWVDRMAEMLPFDYEPEK